MLVPVEPGLDSLVVMLPSTETEDKIAEPTIAPAAQLETFVSSKDPVATKFRQGKQLPMQYAN